MALQESAARSIINHTASSWFQYWSGHVANYTLVLFYVSRPLFHEDSVPWWLGVFCFVLGFFIWTFVEYAAHRWLYHGPLRLPRVGHGMHHEDPVGPIAMPWYLNISVNLGIYFVFRWALGPSRAGLLMGGFWSGHVVYTLFHYVIHNYQFQSKWYRKYWRHHQVHHQMDHVNLGVTTLFWDRLLGTYK